MKIVKETKETFANAGSKAGGKLRPESTVALEMKIDEVIRIVDHEHKSPDSQRDTACNVSVVVRNAGKRHGRKYSIRHDGADLLVMRVK